VAQVAAAVSISFVLETRRAWEPKISHWNSLTRELEKKFSDRHVIILGMRRILPRPKRSNRSRTNQTQKRPRSRTLKSVHDNILTDLVYPVEIVGRRCLQRVDGSRVTRIILDEKERGSVDYRLDTYTEVYKRLTGTHVNFEFPMPESNSYI
jgi:small subunit ribosomal protein S7e